MLELIVQDSWSPLTTLKRNIYVKWFWDESLETSVDDALSLYQKIELSDNYQRCYWPSSHRYAASKGNINAQFFAANQIKLLGEDCSSNEQQSREEALKFEWLKNAADHGHLQACDSLAYIYETWSADTTLALKYYSIASEKNDVFALFHKGKILVARNDNQGLDLIDKAVDQDSYEAAVFMGKYHYERYKHGKTNMPAKYLRIIMRNDTIGDVLYDLGSLRDDFVAYLASANKGFAQAQYKVGRMLIDNSYKYKYSYIEHIEDSPRGIKSYFRRIYSSNDDNDYIFGYQDLIPKQYRGVMRYEQSDPRDIGAKWIEEAAKNGSEEAKKYAASWEK